MKKQNLHTHTNFCDGKNTAEEMVLSAIDKGYDSLGFSAHIKTSFPSVALKDKDGYVQEILRLKQKYDDKIEIYLGAEFDLYSVDNVKDYEYTIGSVHFDIVDGKVISYDDKYDKVKHYVDTFFSGNGIEFAKKYYQAVKRLPDAFNFDIVGHLDVVTKHNEKHNLFDDNHPEYIESALDALHYLIKRGKKLFEINLGGITRGYKTCPYPSNFLLKEMVNAGCEFVITSDAHKTENLTADLTPTVEILKKLGVNHVMYFNGKNFIKNPF